MAAKRKVRGRSDGKPRPRRYREYECIECARPRRSRPSQTKCEGCGGSLCEACRDMVRQCSSCSEYYCSSCVGRCFHLECKSCSLVHHDDCARFLECSHCGLVACDDCGYKVKLCLDCEGAGYCLGCESKSISPDGSTLGACYQCDRRRPSEAALSEWTRTGTLTNDAMEAVLLYWSADVVDNCFSDGEFCESFSPELRPGNP